MAHVIKIEHQGPKGCFVSLFVCLCVFKATFLPLASRFPGNTTESKYYEFNAYLSSQVREYY